MSAPKCEVSWPLTDGCSEYRHPFKDAPATFLVSWYEKRGKQTFSFTCCEDHAIAAQAWGNVSVYRLELVDSPEGGARGEEPT